PGFEASNWFGVAAPRNTSPEIIDKLNKEINVALGEPDIKARLADLGAASLTSLLKKVFEVSRWATLIQDPSARRTKDSQPSGFGFEYCASHVGFRVFQQTGKAKHVHKAFRPEHDLPVVPHQSPGDELNQLFYFLAVNRHRERIHQKAGPLLRPETRATSGKLAMQFSILRKPSRTVFLQVAGGVRVTAAK